VLLKILSACVLVAATVSLHAIGLAALLRALIKSHALPPTRFWPITWLLIRVAWALIFIHVTEITVWALFYLWRGCLPDAQAAFYFAGVTYTTVGYGDLLLPEPWQLLAPIEGLTGILMCGLSTGVFFIIVSRLFFDRFKVTTSEGTQP
jgi:Ion channel